MMREIPRRKLMLATVIAGCALFVGVPRDAEAQPAGPKAEVIVIHGTTCATPSVDPRVGEVPPLKYNCWKFLDKQFLPLVQAPKPASTMQLKNGRTFQLAYKGSTPATPTTPVTFTVDAAISTPDGTGFNQLAHITAEAGKKFNVGGFAYQDGTTPGVLVLAIRIVP